MKTILILALLIGCAACSTEGVKKDPKPKKKHSETAQNGPKTAEQLLEPHKTIQAKKEFPNGLKIQWFEKGTGEPVKDGEVYEINYKVKLTNGEVIDGNHLLKRDWLPFLVGFNMQSRSETGEHVKDGEVYEINYKVKLTNGEVIDGNHLLKRDWLPFLVGFNMQSKGWDMAMTEMHVGDFTEVYLPANLARGREKIDGVVPPNSPNIIFLRIGKRIK